jgi:hypothetical protein
LYRVDLTTGQTIIRELCDLLADPRGSTSAPANGARRTLNKAVFIWLYIDADDESSRPPDELNEHVAPSYTRHDTTTPPSTTGTAGEEGEITLSEISLTKLIERAFGSGCSSKDLMVGQRLQHKNTLAVTTGPDLQLPAVRERAVSPA